jgi:hypothetical protein
MAGGGITNPLPERFPVRVIGFHTTETLNALSTNHWQIRVAGSQLMEPINERRLSDSRLSSDEDYLSLSFQGLAEVAVQLRPSGFAIDHFPPGVDAHVGRRPSADFTHRGYELITPPWESFNELQVLS